MSWSFHSVMTLVTVNMMVEHIVKKNPRIKVEDFILKIHLNKCNSIVDHVTFTFNGRKGHHSTFTRLSLLILCSTGWLVTTFKNRQHARGLLSGWMETCRYSTHPPHAIFWCLSSKTLKTVKMSSLLCCLRERFYLSYSTRRGNLLSNEHASLQPTLSKS